MSAFDRPIPMSVVIGGGLLMSVAIGVTALAHNAIAHAPPRTPNVDASRLLLAREAPDGVLTLAGLDGRTLRTFPAGGDSFLRSVVEKLDVDRDAQHVPGDPPIRLVRWTTGRLSMVDPATGRDISLDSFGPGNAADAASLLTARGA